MCTKNGHMGFLSLVSDAQPMQRPSLKGAEDLFPAEPSGHSPCVLNGGHMPDGQTGTVVTGMAAFIVRTKRAGGPKNMFREVGAIAALSRAQRTNTTSE
jgi:hypothetical protein